MTLRDTTQTILGKFAEVAEDFNLPGLNALAAGKARAEAERQRLENAEQHRLAEIDAARARVQAYLAQERRDVAAITADIASTQADMQRDTAKIAEIDHEITSGDLEPLTKTATELTRLQLAMKAHSAKLARLQSELTDAEQAAVVRTYAASVDDLQTVASSLAAFEAGEWIRIKSEYEQAVNRIRRDRARLNMWQIAGRDQFADVYGREATRAVGEQLADVDKAHPELTDTMWNGVQS